MNTVDEFKKEAGIGAAPAVPGKISNYRWRICALLFFATTINYIDRQVLGILAPQLQHQFNWSESDYGMIVTAFQSAYALGFLFMGRLMDRIGIRSGYVFSIIFWSLAAMLHALFQTAAGFSAMRFMLGLGEAGNFPAAVKAAAEWFPKKDRAMATGIFVSGSSIGAIIAPLCVPLIAIHFGWQWAFILTGLLGFVWAIFWLLNYYPPEKHPGISAGEWNYIKSDPVAPQVSIPWLHLLKYRQTWAFALGKFLTDPIFAFFFFFLPKFFNAGFGITLGKIGPPLMVIYLMSDLGSLAGGWFSSFLIKKNWSVNASRKTAMLAAALCATPVYFASQTDHLWTAVVLIGLALAAHQAFSANILTITTDMFPARAIGSVVGLGSAMGALGGMFSATAAGLLLQYTGSYTVLFMVAGSAYITALLVVHLLAPKLAYVDIKEVP